MNSTPLIPKINLRNLLPENNLQLRLQDSTIKERNQYKGGTVMDIAALSMSMNQIGLMNQVGTAVLSKSLDSMETMGDGMRKIMEASVTPQLGQNVDYSI